MSDLRASVRAERIPESEEEMLLLIALLGTALVVSVMLGIIAKMPGREIALQSAAMCSAALIFYGLVALL